MCLGRTQRSVGTATRGEGNRRSYHHDYGRVHSRATGNDLGMYDFGFSHSMAGDPQSVEGMEGQAMTVTIDVHVVVSVTKVRKGWQVSKIEADGKSVPICWFAAERDAYAYAFVLEHGL